MIAGTDVGFRAVAARRGVTLWEETVHLLMGGLIAITTIISATAVDATEIRVLAANAMSSVLDALRPDFESATGSTLVITLDTAGGVTRRIEKNETADVVITTSAGIDRAIKSHKILAESLVVVARVGLGIAVRAGTMRPDIGSVESFKRTLLASKSIVYADPSRGGVGGAHFANILSQLGIAEEMNQKTKLVVGRGSIAALVAKGGADIGVTQMSELVGASGIDIVGPIPAVLQRTTVFAAGVSAHATRRKEAFLLINLISGPAAATVLRARGMEPN